MGYERGETNGTEQPSGKEAKNAHPGLPYDVDGGDHGFGQPPSGRVHQSWDWLGIGLTGTNNMRDGEYR